jgi:hypothetical protein
LVQGVAANRNGVGVLIDKSLKDGVVEVRRQGDRIISDMVLNIISAYAPQVGQDESANRHFWEDLDDLVRAVPSSEKLFIGGYLNGHPCTIGATSRRHMEVSGMVLGIRRRGSL